MTRDKDGYEMLPEPLVEGTVEYCESQVKTLLEQIEAKFVEFQKAGDHEEADLAIAAADELASGLQDALQAVRLASTGGYRL